MGFFKLEQSPNRVFGLDLLRFVAIFMVLLGHSLILAPKTLKPFVYKFLFDGVAIFFVLSGFLIGGILIKQLNKEKPSLYGLVDFWKRRWMRTLPAYLIILIFLLIYTAFFIPKNLPEDWFRFFFFTQNLFAYRPSFFAEAWSLSIEEQFYIIWPFILWIGYKCKLRIALLIVALWTISFAINIYYAYHSPVLDFYSPQSRFWELLTGAFIANLALSGGSAGRMRLPGWASDSLTQILSILGFAMLVVGVTVTYAHSRFPAWLALLPVIGATLLIAAGPRAWINQYFLASRPMVALGLISYPLYLWHWILLSYAQIWGPVFIVQRLALVALSVMLAWLTYLLIEKPLRNNDSVRKKALLLLLGMALVLACALVFSKNGFEQRPLNQITQFEFSGEDGGNGGFQEDGCGLSDPSLNHFFASCLQDKREPAQFALIGDSHATSLWPGLIRTSVPQYRWLTINGPGGPQNMRPYLSNARQNVSAKDSVYTDKAVEQLIANPNIKVVLLTFSSNSLLPSMADASEYDQAEAYKGLDSVVTKLISNHKKVVLLVDNPHLAAPQDCFHRKVGISALDNFNQIEPACEMPIDQYLAFTAKYRAVLNKLALAHPNAVYVFDATPYLCSKEQGVCSYQKEGRRMYSYGAHVSDYAAGKVGEPLNQYLTGIVSGK